MFLFCPDIRRDLEAEINILLDFKNKMEKYECFLISS